MKSFFQNVRRSAVRLALVPAAVVAFTACDDDNNPVGPQITQDIVEIAAATPEVSTLVAALTAAGLADDLQGDGPFTVFAPVNSVFDALGADVISALLEAGNADLLTKILTFHVVPGAAVLSSDLSDGQSVTTLQGESLSIGVSGSGVTVNGASVTTADIEATNGVIHLIDGVLTPELDIVEKAILTSETQTLVDAVVAGDLVSVLQSEGPFTVFAPVNAAFAGLGNYTLSALLDPANKAILQKVLTYHVVPGKVLSTDLANGQVATAEGSTVTIDIDGAAPTVNGVSVVAADIEVANGVIHLVEGVLLPEFDIVETAILTAETGTLASVVAAGGLVETLQGDGPFTVFAPVNSAFDALGSFTVLELLDPSNIAILQDILTYHVVPGAVLSSALSDGATAATVEGGSLTFDLSGDTPKVNGANIVATDIEVANGVIHLIDGVLLESLDVVQRAVITEQTQTVAAAVVAGGLVETLQGDGPFTVFAPVQVAFEALGTDKLEVLLAEENQALLQKILTYHVVSGAVYSTDLANGTVTTVQGSDVTIDIDGDAPTVNGAAVVAADIQVANGVIHLIDGVLTENLDLVDVATLNKFPTLVSLVEQQGLTATLRSDNGGAGFTVFAPTEDAFAGLSAVPSGDALTQVLLYHVVAATVESSDLSDGQVVTSANSAGDTFTVNIDSASGAVSITDGAGNTVNVVLTDVPAANGVIHVIDGVKLPS
jgi:transforming growth factor-beta-induced protein